MGFALFRRVIQIVVQYFQKKSDNAYEEEMRREDMLEAVKQIIPSIVLGICVLLCAVGGYSYWSYRKDQNLFHSELIYDEYVKTIRQGKFDDAKKLRVQLSLCKEMQTLLEIEDCSVKILEFEKNKKSEEKRKEWYSIYDAYHKLDGKLFPTSRAQSSLYHFTRFVLAVLAMEVRLEDPKEDVVGLYTRSQNSFSGLGYGIQALRALEKGVLNQKLIDQWEQSSQSWIPGVCAIGAGLSRTRSKVQ
ncbi:hypothetical protein P618_200613 [Holospora obtusa F1]|uniref:Uncharacterized protein n=1 Tax=Holospora obtusa F1 TaxID=1399147 RepID=W6TEJ9_HOLOB|nr:hypothetical protein [Holospora obtusa]ETZ07219.1 hypothetical protein P618_200613 [Holospora obtusa F1]